MVKLHSCPDANLLRRLQAGDYELAEIESIAEHLESCSACLDRLQASKSEDTAVEVLRCGLTGKDLSPRAQELLQQFAAVSSISAETAIIQDRHEGSESLLVELASILSAPKGPGEIGWLGGYRAVRVLGRGGMGAVFLAEDLQLKRSVALKVMLPALALDSSLRQRFLREAQAAAGIKHENVVTIYQVGQERDCPYLAMEYLDGESLGHLLRREKKVGVAGMLRIGREIADGLAAAHERGLIHRDIKPDNIWLEGSRPRVKVLDFGLAWDGAGAARLTQSGAIVGTPAYMAPEQARGEKVDARSDLFSLGCVLYQMATHQPPFKGGTVMAILRQLELHDPPAPSRINPSVAPRLSALIARLLAKDPGGRPPSAKQVVDELDAIANDLSAEPTVIRPAMPAPPLRIGIASIFRKISPRSAWAFGGSAAFIVGILLTWQFLTSNVAQKKALSPLALVSDPAKIKGLQSWTLETANQRGKFHWLKYSLDGKLLASGGEDGTVRLWEPSTGKLAKILVTGTEVRHPAWSPDSKSLGAWHDGKYWASMKHTMHWSDEPDLSATIISAWQPGRQWGASKPAM